MNKKILAMGQKNTVRDPRAGCPTGLNMILRIPGPGEGGRKRKRRGGPRQTIETVVHVRPSRKEPRRLGREDGSPKDRQQAGTHSGFYSHSRGRAKRGGSGRSYWRTAQPSLQNHRSGETPGGQNRAFTMESGLGGDTGESTCNPK